MDITKIFKDIFNKIDYLNENVENPFLNKDNQSNPFSRFYSGTYIWIESNNNKDSK